MQADARVDAQVRRVAAEDRDRELQERLDGGGDERRWGVLGALANGGLRLAAEGAGVLLVVVVERERAVESALRGEVPFRGAGVLRTRPGARRTGEHGRRARRGFLRGSGTRAGWRVVVGIGGEHVQRARDRFALAGAGARLHSRRGLGPAARRESRLVLVVVVRFDDLADISARSRRLDGLGAALQSLAQRAGIGHLGVIIGVVNQDRHPRLCDIDVGTDAPRIAEDDVDVHRIDAPACVSDVPAALGPRDAGAAGVRVDGIDLASAVADRTASDGAHGSSCSIGLERFRGQTTHRSDGEGFFESRLDGTVKEGAAGTEWLRTVLGERGTDLGAPEVGGHLAEAAAAEGVSFLCQER